MSRIFCIVGKSSTGKDTLYKRIMEEDGGRLVPVIPCTTRPMRVYEKNGVDYHFFSVEEMEALEARGEVIEKRQYLTTQGIWNYFTLKFEVEENKDYILITTLEGATKIMEHYGSDLVHLVYLYVDDKVRLMRYIEREAKQPKPDYSEVCRRFLADQKDFSEENLSVFKNIHPIDTGADIEDCFKEWRKIFK